MLFQLIILYPIGQVKDWLDLQQTPNSILARPVPLRCVDALADEVQEANGNKIKIPKKWKTSTITRSQQTSCKDCGQYNVYEDGIRVRCIVIMPGIVGLHSKVPPYTSRRCSRVTGCPTLCLYYIHLLSIFLFHRTSSKLNKYMRAYRVFKPVYWYIPIRILCTHHLIHTSLKLCNYVKTFFFFFCSI
jgi:hypothetical protein